MNDTAQQPHQQPSQPRPSACPGLLRIVQARDGGICRIKLPAGRLQASQALAVAAAAEEHGSGVIEVTNRANLQIRGVRAGQEAALIARLLAAGLGPSSPGADDVRNLMVSPAAGIDPAALLDVSPLADRLLATLQDNASLHRLSAKFALLLDGGERLAMLEHPHDLWLSAMPGGSQPLFAFGLAGCPPLPGSPEMALATVTLEQVPALVLACLELFLELAGPEHSRMRHLLTELPAEDFLQRLQARLDFPLRQGEALRHWRRPAAEAWAHLGVQPQLQPGLVQVGAAPPLGRLHARQLIELARLAQQFGDASLRLTPWQSLSLPNIRQADGPALLHALDERGLVCDPLQPLARIIACSGSAGCGKGLAATKADALTLATRLAGSAPLPGLHLSGCLRSCAAAHDSPLTLLAVADGRYDLYQRAAAVSGFGRPLARHLTIAEAGDLLAALPDPMETDR
ncbi:precorrin-3B synthase [Pseudomonas cavernicola]|uniref:precorrin-3B synthase n=1 Tax=Pseudomonas cavernicola TaxID=2320866 RepID=UPI001EE5D80B|nr:precorrin-3B synthase [Pseudomonas cavernicola]